MQTRKDLKKESVRYRILLEGLLEDRHGGRHSSEPGQKGCKWWWWSNETMFIDKEKGSMIHHHCDNIDIDQLTSDKTHASEEA